MKKVLPKIYRTTIGIMSLSILFITLFYEAQNLKARQNL